MDDTIGPPAPTRYTFEIACAKCDEIIDRALNVPAGAQVTMDFCAPPVGGRCWNCGDQVEGMRVRWRQT